jgi:hypothetical protein
MEMMEKIGWIVFTGSLAGVLLLVIYVFSA